MYDQLARLAQREFGAVIIRTETIGRRGGVALKLRFHVRDGTFIDVWLSTDHKRYAYHWEQRAKRGICIATTMPPIIQRSPPTPSTSTTAPKIRSRKATSLTIHCCVTGIPEIRCSTVGGCRGISPSQVKDAPRGVLKICPVARIGLIRHASQTNMQ